MARPIDNLPPIHPGSFLRDELEALDLSARKLAEHIYVPHNAVTGIMNAERSVTAQMAIRLGQAFGTTPRYWLNLQAIYDLKMAQAEMPAEALQIKSCSRRQTAGG
jgi:addiction module HigA family antidote